MKLAGYVGAIYSHLIGDNPTHITGETVSGSGVNYQLANSNVDIDSVVLYDNGSEIAKGNYTVTVAGKITLSSAPSGTLTADYDYYTVSQVGGFFNWTLEWNVDVLDATEYNTNGFREYEAVLKGWNANADRYWLDENYFNNVGSMVIIKLFLDKTGNRRYEGWARISGVSPNVAVNEIIKEPITFTGINNLSFENP